jgi:hypothetical protein
VEDEIYRQKMLPNFTGKQIPISHPVGDRLFPTVHICEASVEANFGNDAAKPFKFDIHNKCPGLVFE